MSSVALVTGASRGIGKAIAIELAKQGMDVAVNYYGNEALANEVVEACKTFGVKSIAVKADVANYDECKVMIDQIVSELGVIEVLVNNAGRVKDTLIMMMKPEDFTSVIDTNLVGAFNCTQLVTRGMVKKKNGRIINLTSVVGVKGNAGQANYSASKAGLIGLTKSVAQELAGKNVLVNAVAPGFIDTDMTSQLNDDIKEAARQVIPLKRYGEAQDIADLVAFLVSDKAKYITGQVIHVDGGMVM